jgi:hypothetical protein
VTDSDIVAFDDYWRIISRNEEYLRQYGLNADANWEEKWHQDLEDAYTRVEPQLSSVTRRRMFHDLPGGLNPLDADNFHHALVKLLNPPECWFGRVGVLTSPEYVAIKRGAAEEEKGICLGAIEVSGPTASVPEATVPEVARRTKLEVNTVGKQSTFLQKAGIIQKVPKRRGFLRLTPLPGEDVNMDSNVNP